MRYSKLCSITRVNNVQGKSRRANVFYVTGNRLTGKRPEGQTSRYQTTVCKSTDQLINESAMNPAVA